MAIKTFKRVEQKYMITKEQKASLIKLLEKHMMLDPFCVDGKTYSIMNIYLDSDDSYLIRNSLLKPKYKEKLRLRKYGASDEIFIEVKKKFDGVVSKRRTKVSMTEFDQWVEGIRPQKRDSYVDEQIIKEIDYLLKLYKVKKKVYIAYDRLGYLEENSDLRVTFDENLRYRLEDLSFNDNNTENIIEKDHFILEIKNSVNMPIWLLEGLHNLGIRKNEFSKYGTQYLLNIKENA